ncbi:MAG: outer membrane beta-barrel protein [Mediterranea sp.]|nr:outer membrane beta-barrel protein [Mediterranea sp.]
MYKHIIALFLSIVSVCVHAQDVVGIVVNQLEQPIEFANVMILSAHDSTFVCGTTTTATGEFFLKDSIDSPPPFLLKVSCIGYKPFIGSMADVAGPLRIVLQEASLGLQEITVTGTRKAFENKDGKLVANIAGTILSREHSMGEVLSMIPGLVNKRGTIEVFGSGSPVFYINNRKVQDINEVMSLMVNDIKSIELITNPGSKYDADVNAVVIIRTTKRDDGLSVQTGMRILQSVYLSHNEYINLMYHKKGLSISTYYQYGNNKGNSIQNSDKEIAGDTLWRYVDNGKRTYRTQRHLYRLGVNYEFTANHYIGFLFNGSYKSSPERAYRENKLSADPGNDINYGVYSDLHTTNKNQQINIFHHYGAQDAFQSTLSIDYISYKDARRQFTSEMYPSSEISTELNSGTSIHIYAGEYKVDYPITEKSQISIGLNANMINEHGTLSTESSYVDGFEYEYRERKISAFAQYRLSLSHLLLEVGARYENMKATYLDLSASDMDMRRVEREIYPSLSLSYNASGFSNTLSFRSQIERPPLSFLNGQTYYIDRFQYQKGNPQLRPQKSYSIEWRTNYRNLNLNISYVYTKDYISTLFEDDPSIGESVLYYTWENFNKAQFVKANVSYACTLFKCWFPSLTIGVIKPFFKSRYLDKSVLYNRPSVYLSVTNSIQLPDEYLFSLNCDFDSGGNKRIYDYQPNFIAALSLKKDFFHKKLALELRWNDMFKSLKYKSSTKINRFYFRQTEDYREWNVSLGVIYRMRSNVKRLRSNSAAREEIQRL